MSFYDGVKIASLEATSCVNSGDSSLTNNFVLCKTALQCTYNIGVNNDFRHLAVLEKAEALRREADKILWDYFQVRKTSGDPRMFLLRSSSSCSYRPSRPPTPRNSPYATMPRIGISSGLASQG